MEYFAVSQTKYRFLVCSDIDGQSATKLTEKFVNQNPEFDAVILSGPFTHQKLTTPEEIAVMGGDIASIIAQFENLVCRVIYLPSEYDPIHIRNEQLNLTPNSLNIHGRLINLTNNLNIFGYSEKNEQLNSSKVPSNIDRSAESDDELENVAVESGKSSCIIKEMLLKSIPKKNQDEEISTTTTTSATTTMSTGIFMLNYRYSHTLNQLLFHMNTEIDAANILLCIITSADCPETSRLPLKFNNLNIVAPKSLRQGGHYVTVDIEYNSMTQLWDNITIQAHIL